MSTTLIPESAPFTPEQRAWLNGFLSGWTGLAGEATDGAAVASDLMPETQAADEPEEDFPWHDDSLLMDERLQLAEGKPLNRRLMAAMAQLDCGACGYVCQTYSEAIACGEEKSLTLCSPGGKETSKMLKKLLKESEAAGDPSTNGQAASTNGQASNGQATKPQAAGSYSRSNPYPAKVKETYCLNGAGSSKHTSHVVIDLAGSGLEYQVGDALGVFPSNCYELVDEIMECLVYDRNSAEAFQLRSALVHEYDLSDAPEELAELLIAQANDPQEIETLSKLLQSDELDDLDILDLLRLAPSAQVEGRRLLELLGPLQPRLYSISSSPLKHPGEVHLTIAKVTYEVDGRLRKGVASTMFADRLRPGDSARVFVHQAADFSVPADPSAPMIMVGPGTGVAPFRAFLEERAVTGATGENWLFFGDQHAATDFLYEDELKDMQQAGTLAQLDVAFSRDQEEKIYVQNRMLQQGAELFAWLERGAYFFVCGDARRMAVDVDRALHEVIATQGQCSADEAAEYVRGLKDSKRYVRDVY